MGCPNNHKYYFFVYKSHLFLDSLFPHLASTWEVALLVKYLNTNQFAKTTLPLSRITNQVIFLTQKISLCIMGSLTLSLRVQRNSSCLTKSLNSNPRTSTAFSTKFGISSYQQLSREPIHYREGSYTVRFLCTLRFLNTITRFWCTSLF